MSHKNLSSVATEVIATYGITATNVINSYRFGGERLIGFVDQRLATAVNRGTVAFNDDIRSNLIDKQQRISSYSAKGVHISTDSKHLQEFGEKMSSKDGERIQYEYFVLPEVFRTEICKGFAHEAVCKVLVDHECLVMNEPGRYAKKVKLPALGQTRCYHIPAKIFELEV